MGGAAESPGPGARSMVAALTGGSAIRGRRHGQGRVGGSRGRSAPAVRGGAARRRGHRRRAGAVGRRRRGGTDRHRRRDRGPGRQAAVLRRRRPAPGHGRPVRGPGGGARLPCALAPRGPCVGQRPADPGAPEHRRRLVHARHGRVARGRRLDQQHLPRQRPAVRQPHGGVRRRRASGRDARPGGRARRQEGRPDRMGRRPQRGDRRPDDRLPQLPLGPRRGDELRCARRLGVVHDGLRPAVRPPGRLRRPGAVPRGRTERGRRLDRRAGFLQPGAGDAPARARRRRRQVRAQRLPLRQHRRRAHELRPRAALADEGRRRRGRRTWKRASGPTSRSRSRAAISTGGRARCSSRRSG